MHSQFNYKSNNQNQNPSQNFYLTNDEDEKMSIPENSFITPIQDSSMRSFSQISNKNLITKDIQLNQNHNQIQIQNQNPNQIPNQNLINQFINAPNNSITHSPLPKPDFSEIEKMESNFQYKQRGSYKKAKQVVPESPMKSPCQKFFTPVKLQSNLFGFHSTFRKLNFNQVEENINEEEYYNCNNEQKNKERNLDLSDNSEDDNNNIDCDDDSYNDCYNNNNQKDNIEHCELKVNNLQLDSPNNNNQMKKKKNKSNNDFKLKKNKSNINKNKDSNDKYFNYRKSSVNDSNLNRIDNEARKKGINKFLNNSHKNEQVNFIDFMKGKKWDNFDNKISLVKEQDFTNLNDINEKNLNNIFTNDVNEENLNNNNSNNFLFNNLKNNNLINNPIFSNFNYNNNLINNDRNNKDRDKEMINLLNSNNDSNKNLNFNLFCNEANNNNSNCNNNNNNIFNKIFSNNDFKNLPINPINPINSINNKINFNDLSKEDSDDIDMETIDHNGYSRFETDFIILGTLESGEFGIVYKCQCRLDNKVYAIKKSKRTTSTFEIVNNKNLILDFGQKSTMDSMFNFVVKYNECWVEDGFLLIKQEYCECGDLLDFMETLEKKNFKLNSEFFWDLIFQMLCGLKYVHSCCYIHLDIKPQNFFIKKDGTVKLGDFNLARKKSIFDHDYFEGDSTYMAPEILESTRVKNLDERCDIFSLGLSIIEILFRIELPQNGPLWRAIRSEGFIFGNDFYLHSNLENISEDFHELIFGMINPDPKKRFGISYMFENFPELNNRLEKLNVNKYKVSYENFMDNLENYHSTSPKKSRSNQMLNM